MAQEKYDFSSVINSARQGAKIPAINIARNPETSSVLSKLISDIDSKPMYDRRGNRKALEPNIDELYQLSTSKMNDINDAESVMQMLPDIELSAQVLISSILSPKDMMNTELTYIPPESVCPPNIAGSLTKLIKNHFSLNYKIESKLPLILRDILFRTGSYSICVIPENAIDEVINNNQRLSEENFDDFFNTSSKSYYLKPKGFLGRADSGSKSGITLEDFRYKDNLTTEDMTIKPSLESLNKLELKVDKSYDLDTYVTVTDNYDILSIPSLMKQMRHHTIEDKLGVGLEEQVTDIDIDQLLHRKMYYQANSLVQIKTNDQGYRKSIGEPLVMHLPTESVIPVYVPGDPQEHVGYFVLIDEFGNPISKDAARDHFSDLGQMTIRNKKCLTSSLLDRGKMMYEGLDTTSIRNRMDYASRAYGEIIEKDLVSRLRNGIYGKSIKIGGADEIYRIMFARALKQQRTQMLFLPMETITYMAFKFDENGMGYSLLDNLKIVNSLSISLMLANNRAAVMNSIPRTKVTVTLDEDEIDVEGRREQIVSEIMLLRSNGNNGIPLGQLDPAAIEQWASQAGVEFHFTGPRDLPEMDIDIQEFQSSIPKPDTELEEDMRKKRIMGLGLSPETIDATQGANFATSIVQESLLFARRALSYQQQFVPLIADHIRKVCLASPDLLQSIEDIIYNNIDDVLTHLLGDSKKRLESDHDKVIVARKAAVAFVKQIEVDLPKPNSLSIDKKKEAFSAYVEAVEDAVKHYISEELLPTDIHGEFGEKARSIQSILVSYYARKWMVENDYLAELSDLVTSDEDDNPIFDIYEMSAEFGNGVMKSMARMLDKTRPMKDATDLYEKVNDVDESEDSGSSYSSSDDSGSDDSDSDDESSGDDDTGGFSFDDGPSDFDS